MPHVESRLTFGNILSLAGTLLSAAAILVTVSSWSAKQEQRINGIEKETIQNRAAVVANEARIRQVETLSARQDERLVLILETVREIKAKVDRPAR